ncbi:phosphotransferase family protein [Nocardia sp. NPDC004568]|uniref:phosphotransferase family protein n=1 Tax=Nocardia sp. NPDC004568 TaxID=3154551 RepID=UPI0033ADF309
MTAVLDPVALAQWMRAQGAQVTGGLSAVRVGQGQSNLIYLLTDEAGARWIARRPPLGELLASAHDVAREYRILHALQDTDVPVPRLVGLCEEEAVADVPVVVMSHVDGTVVDRMDVAESLDPTVRRAVGLGLVRTLARIHSVDVDTVGLGDLASRSPYAERQLRRWTRQFEDSRTRDRPDLEALTALLQANIPPAGDLSLVHGDFHVCNTIVDPATGAPNAVLDWELSTLGDPIADLGTTLAYWPQAGERPSGTFAAPTLPGFPRREEMAAEYLSASGRDGASLAFWHVLGVWKIAIICDGVHRRVLDNPANAATSGVPTPESIQATIDHAWEIAAGYGLAEQPLLFRARNA